MRTFFVICNSFISDKEKQDSCSCVVEVDGPQTTIKNPNGSKVTTFTYDYSYFQDAKSVNYYNSFCGLSYIKFYILTEHSVP